MFIAYHKRDMEVFHYSFFQDAPSEEVKAKLNIKHWRKEKTNKNSDLERQLPRSLVLDKLWVSWRFVCVCKCVYLCVCVIVLCICMWYVHMWVCIWCVHMCMCVCGFFPSTCDLIFQLLKYGLLPKPLHHKYDGLLSYQRNFGKGWMYYLYCKAHIANRSYFIFIPF